MKVIRVVSAAAFARSAAEHVAGVAEATIAANGRFTIVLSGGTTPRSVYEVLAGSELSRRIDWSRVHVFWGDERCVPPDDVLSNYRMASDALLQHVPIPTARIHRIRGEDYPCAAAAAYETLIQHVLAGGLDNGRASNGFDLVLLGVGSDGHTASLFPGRSAVREQKRWVVSEFVEHLSQWRITLTPVAINAAAHVLVLVAGEGKAEAVRAVLEGPYQPEMLPAQAIQPRSELTWILDTDAASRLKQP